MNIKEKDHIPNSEVFVMEEGEPIKKILKNFYKIKK